MDLFPDMVEVCRQVYRSVHHGGGGQKRGREPCPLDSPCLQIYPRDGETAASHENVVARIRWMTLRLGDESTLCRSSCI